jgi:hypothetical protein
MTTATGILSTATAATTTSAATSSDGAFIFAPSVAVAVPTTAVATDAKPYQLMRTHAVRTVSGEGDSASGSTPVDAFTDADLFGTISQIRKLDKPHGVSLHE